MRLRTLGVTLALVLTGVAGGFVAGNLLEDDPAAIAAVAPVPAESPGYPVNEYDVLPDPGIAPLGTDLPSHTATLRSGEFGLEASVPDDWRRVTLLGGSTWNFAAPDNLKNTYVLRIGLIAGQRLSAPAAKGGRILALQTAVADGNLEHLVIESETDNGFVATYLDDGYLRVTMERWLTFPDVSTSAYASVAITGREVDRAGMADLLERVAASATPVAARDGR